MFTRKKILVLLVLVAVLTMCLSSAIAEPNASNEINSNGLNFSLTQGDFSNTAEWDLVSSNTPLLPSDILWAPGCMYLIPLQINNDVSGSQTTGDFYYSLELNISEAAGDAPLSEVIEVYLCDGIYKPSDGRPELDAQDTADWQYLGLLKNPKTFYGQMEYAKATKAHTFLLKMKGEAGNDYQGKTASIFISMTAQQIPFGA